MQHHVLLSKITAPLNSSNAFLDNAAEEYDSEWIDTEDLVRLISNPKLDPTA